MFKTASFRNFKSLRHVDVDFERLTVIVGPNASGKTSILEGLHLLSQIGSADSPNLFSDLHDPINMYSRGATESGLELSCSGDSAGLRVTFPRRSCVQGRLRPERLRSRAGSRIKHGQTWGAAGSNRISGRLFFSDSMLANLPRSRTFIRAKFPSGVMAKDWPACLRSWH